MFEFMTLYRPVNAVVAEERGIGYSIYGLLMVFLFYAIVITFFSVMVDNLSFFSPPATGFTVSAATANRLLTLPLVFVFVLVQVPICSGAVFLVSRLFSKNGSFQKILALNYFIVSSTSLFTLLLLVPLAEFAGMVMLFLGVALSLYFLNEAFEKVFAVQSSVSVGLLILYLGLTVVLLLGFLSLTGPKVPVG